MAGTASQTAQQAMEYTRDAASGMAERVTRNPLPLVLLGVVAAWLLTRRRAHAAEPMRGMAHPQQNRFQGTVHDHPLLVGAGALMLGAAVGLAIPETEMENEWMGEARDNVVARAREMVRDAVGQV